MIKKELMSQKILLKSRKIKNWQRLRVLSPDTPRRMIRDHE